MSEPLAYFITAHTYGSRLHGDPRGSVDWNHRQYGEPLLPANDQRSCRARELMQSGEITLHEAARAAVQSAIVEVAKVRNWTLLALHVRTTHFHSVVVAGAKPEKVLVDFKAYATRRLRGEALFGREQQIWSEHGSTRYLWDEDAVANAVTYTLDTQGAQLNPEPFRGQWPG